MARFSTLLGLALSRGLADDLRSLCFPAFFAILARADALFWRAQKLVCNAALSHGEAPGALGSDKAVG